MPLEGLIVDRRPGLEQTLLMPGRHPVHLASWREADGVYIGRLGDGREVPVIEVRCLDGRIFKIE